ncbi:CYIR protein [Plasmodium cynomolgi strain B]|uniref:CYIR protein n=1 Tax=Plasmodium cynomolgi (strain B) TaxID=1120755 RepID=K6VKG9_PLACD|nr:CYIR protein [Plasmodium cynomolgi strain B]GAB69937.1 CYIR protein [Plasmodium cynomolgi strain B]
MNIRLIKNAKITLFFNSILIETQKLYDEKCFYLVICNEHKEDFKYETYIKFDELITQCKDYDAYKASSEPKEDNECKCARKSSNSY